MSVTDLADAIYAICPYCGKRVPTTRRHPNKPHESCRQDEKNRKARAKRAQQEATKYFSNPDAWIVLRDPLPLEEGGFSPGARFGSTDVAEMLNNAAFTPGTTLTYVRTRHRFQVVDEGDKTILRNSTEVASVNNHRLVFARVTGQTESVRLEA